MLCESGSPVRDLGYLPVYRDDYVPCVLIVHEYTFEPIGRLPNLTQVTWGRHEDDDAEAVYVTQKLVQVRFETAYPSRKKPQDISVATARYWKRPDLLADLVRWFNAPAAVTDSSPPAELVARVTEHQVAKSGPPRLSTRAAIESVTGEKLPELIGDISREALKRNKKLAGAPLPNGTAH